MTMPGRHRQREVENHDQCESTVRFLLSAGVRNGGTCPELRCLLRTEYVAGEVSKLSGLRPVPR
jgi:hypothetical protein